MNRSLELLRLLGSPLAPQLRSKVTRNESRFLYAHSVRNRMPYLYLETAVRIYPNDFSRLYEKEKSRLSKTNKAIVMISKVLEHFRVDYAFFKTIRPYNSTTVDLDLVIFGEGNYARSVKAIKGAGYSLVVYGPCSTTFWDREANIGIDLYRQVAVSYVTYIDVRNLSNHVTTTEISGWGSVRTLKPEADLACIIAHSLIKEQMYTLSEYFSFIHYLERMNIDDFLQIVKENNISFAARTHCAITALLHGVAHGVVPDKLQRILDTLGGEMFEPTRLVGEDFDAPHKYHPFTIARSLFEIAKGKQTRRSIALQLANMFDLRMSNDFMKKFVEHLIRETY